MKILIQLLLILGFLIMKHLPKASPLSTIKTYLYESGF